MRKEYTKTFDNKGFYVKYLNNCKKSSKVKHMYYGYDATNSVYFIKVELY